MIDNVFVVSLPRTGTTTLCKMGQIVGFKPKHVPLMALDDMVAGSNFNFFADTPCFSVDHISNHITGNNKFIYIVKEPKAWYDSWEKIGLLHQQHAFVKPDFKPANNGQVIDRDVYMKAMGDEPITESNYETIFNRHFQSVTNTVPDEKLLIYNLDSGWEPFCEFLNVETPQTSVPHLNTNTMFDQI